MVEGIWVGDVVSLLEATNYRDDVDTARVGRKLLLLHVCVDKMIPNELHFVPFFSDFVQLTKDGVCPKESKQKEREPSRGPKYARRRQKFYIYS